MLQFFGKIENPFQRLGVSGYGGPIGPRFGLIIFLNNLLKLIVVIAGIFALFNVIIAGYQFMTAMGDPKGITNAWNKIWQSLIGLVLVASSFVLAAIFGWLLFGDATAILQPKIYGPGG
jgi:hypothetical protein